MARDDNGKTMASGTQDEPQVAGLRYGADAGTGSGAASRPGGGGPGRRGGRGGRGGPVARMLSGEKAKDFKGTIRKLVVYLGNFRFAILGAIVITIGATVFNVLGPKVLGTATTTLVAGVTAKVQGTGGIDFLRINRILLLALGLYLVSAAFQGLQSWVMAGITQRLSYRMRNDISRKIDRLPLGFFETRPTGDTLSRITNDVDTLGQSIDQSITTLITSVTTVIGIVVLMFSMNVLMTLIVLLLVPFSLLVVRFVVKRSQKYFFAQQRYLGAVNGQVEEVFSGIDVVKAFNREGREIGDFEETNAILYHSAWRSQFLSGMMRPLMDLVSNLGYVGIAIVGAALAMQGIVTIGDIQAFIIYEKNFTQPITQLAQVSNMLQSMAAAAERVFEFLDAEEEPQDAPDVPAMPEHIDEISFEHVRFGYDPEVPVIKDFSTRVERGQTIALVGPTGAGKTTVVKLLMRFYDVDDGSIRINGTDLREFGRSDLRSHIAMVLQDTWLFKGTIMENIRFGRLDATDEEVREAARMASADHFIQTLSGGYETEIDEEASNISQGQRQLITIARALLANRELLILDEATSSVDTHTEMQVQQAMDSLMRGRTSFVIAHRLSTIRNADRILVLRDGDIVEQGTHDELLAMDGFYAELYNSQFDDAA